MTLLPLDSLGDLFDGLVIKIRIVLRNDTTENWQTKNPILRSGEAGVCTNAGGKFKLGNGVTHFNDLPYYLNEDDVAAMVASMIEASGGGSGGGVTPADLQAHIDSESPHPVYDDGTSFVLRYENAKV